MIHIVCFNEESKINIIETFIAPMGTACQLSCLWIYVIQLASYMFRVTRLNDHLGLRRVSTGHLNA